MPVEHMVWFRFGDDVPQARREHHADRLRGLVGRVPGILRLEVGWNFTDRARGAQLGLLVTLESKAALDAYQVHIDHVEVARGLRADCDEILALDFESC
jgi:hypothetical protein